MFTTEVIREKAMGAAVRLRADLSAGELRVAAKPAADADQARRLFGARWDGR
jgi:hypothetical protein